jgi:hypothetical protein
VIPFDPEIFEFTREVMIMSKLTMVGVASWLIGGLLLGFQAISTLMQTGDKYVWESLSLVDIFGKDSFKWIEGISYASVQSAASYVSTMPLYLLLFALGLLFFIINFIKPKV